jgi:hypothetical protein
MRASRTRTVLLTFATTLAATAGLGVTGSAPAHAASDPAVDAFVKSFVASFEKSTGTKIPKAEATCIGTKFLAKIKVGELLKAAASNDLTVAQKGALSTAFGACLSGATYKAVIKHNLAAQFTPGQLTCLGDKAVSQLGVPALIAVDFKEFAGAQSAAAKASTAKTESALTKIALSCAKA